MAFHTTGMLNLKTIKLTMMTIKVSPRPRLCITGTIW